MIRADALLGTLRNPMERLHEDQATALAWRDSLSTHSGAHGARLALLACGHFVWTRSRHRAACVRCGAMIRSGYDYQAFRYQGADDTFIWTEDPFRTLNEPASRR